MFFDFNPTSAGKTAVGAMKLIERQHWQKGLLFPKISRVLVRESDPATVDRVIESSLRSLGCTPPLFATLSNDLSCWFRGSGDYAVVENGHIELLDNLQRSALLPEKLLYYAGLLSALGFFSLSLKVQRLAREKIRGASTRTGSIRDWIRRLQVEIASGNKSEAVYSLENIRRLTQLNSYTRKAWNQVQPVADYVNLWAGDTRPPHTQSGDPATNLVIGPGPINQTFLNSFSGSAKAFHLAGPGAFDFHQFNTDFGLETGGLYTNQEDLTLILRDPLGSETLSKYNFVGVKRSTTGELSNLRAVNNAAWLFLSGHTNKAIFATLDIFSNSRLPVVIAGVTFFATEANYRPSAIRHAGRATKTDSTGSFGGQFDRCGAFASHNLFENRAILRNLYHARILDGDDPFRGVMKLSDTEYARRLDSLYGMERR